jgi:hypothetical protein
MRTKSESGLHQEGVTTKVAEVRQTLVGKSESTPDDRIPILEVGPDAAFIQGDGELNIAVREALLNVERRIDPPLLLTVCPEVLWRFLRDREPLERLGFPWSLEVFRRIEELARKHSLSEEERRERLWLHSINSQMGESLALAQTAVSALFSEPVLRQSGYLDTPAELILALKGTISRVFGARDRVNAGVKLDLYRVREPRIGVSIRVPDAVLERVLKGLGSDNPLLLTIEAGTFAGELPAEILTGAAIPAIVLEVYRVTDKVPSYTPDPRCLALSDWFLGLG